MPQAIQKNARLVVLISGNGSNLQTIIDNCAQFNIPATIAAVVSNRPNCFGLERAAKAGIPAITIDHTQFDSREAFDKALATKIESYSPDLIILAGFMRILTPEFVQRFEGRLLNIHPSLLPKYTGLNTHQRAIDAGDEHAGVTVHFVTQELDGGPPVIQARVAIDTNETADTLAKKVLQEEYRIYSLAIKWFCQGRLSLVDNKVQLDQKVLQTTGLALWETPEAI